MIRYLITDGSAAAGDEGWLARLDYSVDIIQIREHGLEARSLARLARAVLKRTAAKVLINDRADVAIATGAHGVQLRAGAAEPGLFRAIAPAGFLVTVACHSVEDVRRAAKAGADYALLAPIFPPRSKAGTRIPLGLEAIRASAGLGIPVIALGGISQENAPLCIGAGAAGVAGISLFAAAPAHAH